MVQTISYSAERVVGTGSFGIVFQVTASVISLYCLVQKVVVKANVFVGEGRRDASEIVRLHSRVDKKIGLIA